MVSGWDSFDSLRQAVRPHMTAAAPYGHRNASASFSDGVFQPRACLGLPLREWAACPGQGLVRKPVAGRGGGESVCAHNAGAVSERLLVRSRVVEIGISLNPQRDALR